MADETPAKERRAFFITPIGHIDSDDRRRSNLVLDHILTPALVPEFVDIVDRADRSKDPGNITPGIVNSIMSADLVVADLSGDNPNVYYELAMAHAFARPMIHIIEEGGTPRFDAYDVNAFPYGRDIDKALAFRQTVKDAAKIAIARGDQPTLVSRAAELKAAATSDNPVERQLADIRELLRDIRNGRDAPSPYAALLDDPLRDLPGLRKTPDEAMASEVYARMTLRHADRDSLARWVTEFVGRFGHLLDRYTGIDTRSPLLLAMRDQPDLVDGLDQEQLLDLAHVALEIYAPLVAAGLAPILPPLPLVQG